MAYVEHEYEEVIDGNKQGALAGYFVDYTDIATKHRQICDYLRMPQEQPMHVSQDGAVLIDYYRRYGHLSAKIGLLTDNRKAPPMPTVSGELSGAFAGQHTTMDADKWHDVLSKQYCASIGYEISHMQYDEQQWLQDVIESTSIVVSEEELLEGFSDIARASKLERFLGIKFVGQKRFSLEGCEALIPCIEQLIKESVKLDYDDVVIGMPHRGRINTLVNVMGLSISELVDQFEGLNHLEETSGDVKYHLGHSADRSYGSKDYHVALAYNPSHLEAINSVVMGNIRARIDQGLTTPMGIIVHGDSSVAGQGVVMEGLALSQVAGYKVGGMVHIVANNQVGFTTLPKDARSSTYCTDIAKMISAPVFHVHADDLEAVLYCAKIAALYRDQFKKDVFIDLIGFRRHGHNEADEPRATQPLMYSIIDKHPGALSVVKETLIQKGINEDSLTALEKEVDLKLKEGSQLISCKSEMNSTRKEAWSSLNGKDWRSKYNMSLSMKDLQGIACDIVKYPSDFNLQKQVANVMNARKEMSQGEKELNWGMAELMAYQSLVNLGFSVRLIGQDAIRGTFSHRHASLYDQVNGKRHQLIDNIDDAQFYNYNSILSEYAALGYEYGYAETNPNSLVVFEAQFGDFINGAQIIIDQFISSGYQKWKRMCGLVLLLPHGYEGQGPEHSSARLERFLQLFAQDNMQICIPSTPAQIYHILMRQMLRKYRRPLVIFSPKSLLRHPSAISSIEDISKNVFQVILDDPSSDKKATRVVICSGKVFYDLDQYRVQMKSENTAIIRLEQIAPFPKEELKKILSKYKNIKDLIWCQEEPHNQGAWVCISSSLQECAPKGIHIRSVTRNEAAAPAVGYVSKHREQQAELVKRIFEEEGK